jgi:hypothetical protein
VGEAAGRITRIDAARLIDAIVDRAIGPDADETIE